MVSVIYRVKLVTCRMGQIRASDNVYYVNFVLGKKGKNCYINYLTSDVTRVTLILPIWLILSLHGR